MKVYIATKFENAAKFHELKSMIELAGHTITHDWTKQDEVGKRPKGDSLSTYCAVADYWGVKHCDVLVFIAVDSPMAGAWVEMGIALADLKKVIVLNNELKNNIFYHLPNVRFASSPMEVIQLL